MNLVEYDELRFQRLEEQARVGQPSAVGGGLEVQVQWCAAGDETTARGPNRANVGRRSDNPIASSP